MPKVEIVPHRDPLDLLWRFVPTPYASRICVGSMTVRIESNDPTLLAILHEITGGQTRKAECTFLWRIVRDAEVRAGTGPPTIITDGDLTFVNMRPALLASVDREHRELLGFVGTGVSNRELKDSVAPLLGQLTLDAREGRGPLRNASVELAATQGNGHD